MIADLEAAPEGSIVVLHGKRAGVGAAPRHPGRAAAARCRAL